MQWGCRSSGRSTEEMMTSAIGDETSSSTGLLSPATTFSQDSGEAAAPTATLGKELEAANLLRIEEPPEEQQPAPPTRQIIGERWPSGRETAPAATPAVGWLSRNGADAEMRGGRQAGGPDADPFAMLPMRNGGGGGGGAGARGSEGITNGQVAAAAGRFDMPVISAAQRRDWSLRSAKPWPSDGATGKDAEGDTASGGGGRAVDAMPAAGSGWGNGLMPPRWVPDEETAACSGCGKAFDWARRRHHCRACGRLYCHACSRFRALLPRSFGTRDPQRLCQPCNARVAPLQETLVESVSNAVKENDVEHGGVASYLNRPIVFTLGAEVRKAAYTIHNFTKEGMIQDRSIPQELLGRAKGLAFLTVIKGGFIVAGRVGTGLVVAKTEEGFWSAPSAIATVGMGYGALIGGEITDFVLVLNTDTAVEAFSGRGQVSVGAELSVAVGPLGRTGAGNVSVAAEGLAHAYSYSHSRGLFAGLSLEGGVIVPRPDVNRKFYGRDISVRELLSGTVAPPPAARPLYEALEYRGTAADQQRLLSQGFRLG